MSARFLQSSSDSAKAIPIDRSASLDTTNDVVATIAKANLHHGLAIDLFSALIATGFALVFFYNDSAISPSWIVVISTSLFLAFTQCLGLHDQRVAHSPESLIPKSFYAAALTTASLGTVSVLVFFNKIPLGLLAFQTLALFSVYAVLRTGSWYCLKKIPPKILILGSSAFCALAEKRLRSGTIPYHVESLPQEEATLEAARAKLSIVDELIVPDANVKNYDRLVSHAVELGIPVSKYSHFIEEKFQRIPVRNITMDWFLFRKPREFGFGYLHAKRVADILIAIVGIILSLPLIALAGIAIYLTDGGGIFYSQTRLGKKKKPFQIYKLRTMVQNAEQSGAKWASKKDSRITLVGKVLRRTRIDELPQFWNILRGEMSFIGPRPERPEFTTKLEEQIPHFSKRHLVKPGLTGWAQINYPYGASEEDAYEKLTLDLYYIKNASPLLDLKIAFRTIGAAMQGAR